MRRTTRVKKFWPVAAGDSDTSVVTETTTLFSDGEIRADDTALITPKNAAAAALEGGATGVYAACTAGVCTITHAAAAGGEIWHVVIIPQGMQD
jgi:hypothetical protein